MTSEVIEGLALKPGDIVVDATVGLGGHSEKILNEILPGGHLIAIDQDREALALAKTKLVNYQENVTFIHANFRDLKDKLAEKGFNRVDKILFDLGVSSMQLANDSRGFSFSKEGPLDMRMDDTLEVTAFDLVNELEEHELVDIFVKLGEESPYHARKLAAAIILDRKQRPITKTTELAELAGRILRRRDKIHPATRIFMGLRIAVNNELGVLREGLTQAFDILNISGKMAVITFHSLEDRIVKEQFKAFKEAKVARLINSHVIKPSREEVVANAASRSAKLRLIERISF